MKSTDFLVIGAGIIGLNVARELKRRFGASKVIVIEKEDSFGKHASGRNSGVLHAGFYYTADSLKAKFTKEGNRLLTEYCESRNIPINKCGKLVVARNEDENKTLDELLARGKRNGVRLEVLSAADATDLEPRAITHERAIFSPTTASVDPLAVMENMEKDAKSEGVEICYSARYLGADKQKITTTAGCFDAKYVVNSAGLYADKVARDFGFAGDYRILPFKGLYLKSSQPAGAFKTNIYPVPDLRNPFLGVHVTVQVDGHAKIGPTAIPAMWREQYDSFSHFRFTEFTDIVRRFTGFLLRSDFDFQRMALSEVQKYSRRRMVTLAGSLARDLKPDQFRKWARPGIRAQLFDVKKHALEMDFVVRADQRSMHILNAVSPGWTCSIPFSRFVCDEIAKQLN